MTYLWEKAEADLEEARRKRDRANQPPRRTRAELQTAIDGISATLKGPGISTQERLMLHEDRKDLRRMLEAMPPEEGAKP